MRVEFRRHFFFSQGHCNNIPSTVKAVSSAIILFQIFNFDRLFSQLPVKKGTVFYKFTLSHKLIILLNYTLYTPRVSIYKNRYPFKEHSRRANKRPPLGQPSYLIK